MQPCTLGDPFCWNTNSYLLLRVPVQILYTTQHYSAIRAWHLMQSPSPLILPLAAVPFRSRRAVLHI